MSGGRVLVVDDTAVNRRLLVRLLAGIGHEAIEASNGLEALAILADPATEPVDVVLLDIMMPEMDGYETLARMKADDALRDLPVIVIAGKEYGSGSSRDWAAKGTLLLGVKAVLAESFERIHRSNLVNMGVLPMCFRSGETATTLKLTGRETYEVIGMGASLRPSGDMTIRVTSEDGSSRDIQAVARIDTPEELVAFRHGGILPYVLRQLAKG